MKIVKIFEEVCPFNPYGGGGIEFDDGTALIDCHYQDCCESVYADFSNLDSDITSYNFKTIRIEPVKYGFKFGDNRRMFFVPCYNVQNGYYSSSLTIDYGRVVQKIAGYTKGKPKYKNTFVTMQSHEVIPKDDIY